MELRDRVAREIAEHIAVDRAPIDVALMTADAILAIPEIKDALRSKCSSCDGARGPLLCTECVRDFIEAE